MFYDKKNPVIQERQSTFIISKVENLENRPIFEIARFSIDKLGISTKMLGISIDIPSLSNKPWKRLNVCKQTLPLTLVFRVRTFSQTTFRVYHVYCNFILCNMCGITVIVGTLKDGSLSIDVFASSNCFSYRSIFQNGIDSLSKLDDAFSTKS